MKPFAGISIVSLVLLSLVACQKDPLFDLKNLDPEITVLKTGFSYPLGSFPKMRLDAIFNMDQSSVLQYDNHGDYYLIYSPDPFYFYVVIPPGGIPQTIFIPFTYANYSFPEAILSDAPAFGLDHTQAEVILDLDSGLPATFQFGISFETYRDGSSVHRKFSYDDLTVNPGPNTLVFRDEKLLDPIPNGFIFNGLNVSIDPEQAALLQVGYTYSIKCQPIMRAPVAFVAGTEFQYSITVNLNYELDGVRIREACLDMLAINTIPLDFEASACCLDSDGNEIPGISGQVDKPIQAGTIDSPSETRVTAKLTSETGTIPDCLTLKMTARVPASLAGTILNREQGIQLTDMRLRLPEGVQVDLF